MSLRLGIDLDGVVADFNGGWVSLYNEQFGTDISRNEITGWGAPPKLTHFRHMGEFWRWAMDINGRTLFRQLGVYPDAVEVLNSLSMWGHEVVILTSKPDWAVHDTYAWIAEHQLPTREVHILDEKWRVPCDVYLDDAPHQLRSLSRHRPDRIVGRMARAWNEPVEGTVAVDSWPAFEKLVLERALGGRI
jgi:5'(3')-deoxyribonucleotidase